jgi:hypothetical protein
LWLIYTIIIIVGWASALGTVVFYFQYLGDLLGQYQHPPQELLDRWANDGAKKVFALMFGWIYALLYSLPWLLLYFVAAKLRSMKNKSIGAQQGA